MKSRYASRRRDCPSQEKPGKHRRPVAKIRTYNFPSGRVTDHRIGLTVYHLDSVMNGDLAGIYRASSLRKMRRSLLERV